MLCMALVACGGKKSEDQNKAASGDKPAGPAKSDRFAKVKQPKVSPVCEAAHLGYGAECNEQELPALTSPAGKLTRVTRKGDPTNRWTYVLSKPDGTYASDTGGNSFGILKQVMQGLDTKAAPPELLAKLFAGLKEEDSIVRCLPGTDDKLPDKDGKPLACAPPAIEEVGGKRVLTFMVEELPHPTLSSSDDHWIYKEKMVVAEHAFENEEGDGLVRVATPSPTPKDFPPVPGMSVPPDFVAKPVPAAADVEAALCAKAAGPYFKLKGHQCKAYAYPSLDVPAGKLFYLANDVAEDIYALRKPDGTIVVGSDFTGAENPLTPLISTYDPKVVPPEKLIALHLFMGEEPVHLLCLPGSGDEIPGEKCEPPTVEKKGDGLVLHYIVEELPLANGHGVVHDPAVRSFSTELSAGGGSLGGGTRLIDMRDN
jgi:hypothetical protein